MDPKAIKPEVGQTVEVCLGAKHKKGTIQDIARSCVDGHPVAFLVKFQLKKRGRMSSGYSKRPPIWVPIAMITRIYQPMTLFDEEVSDGGADRKNGG